jgi:L,D-transpeptidase YcbB
MIVKLSTAFRTTLLAAAGLLACASAQAEQTSSIGAAAPQSGKLATRTEIVADRNEAAMVTIDSRRAIRAAIEMYRAIADNGGWPEIAAKRLSKGDKHEQVLLLRQRLAIEGYLPGDAAGDPSTTFDPALAQALKAFQINHGLPATGKLDPKTRDDLNIPADFRLATLEANEFRVAEYAKGLGARAILVNIPSAQLEAVNLGQVYSRHNVVVGKLDRPSPAVKSRVSEINFNPYWNVPASIVDKDLIPKLIADPFAMEKMRIRIFDGFTGPEIEPDSVDWTTTPPDRFFFRQDPGAGNSLSTVKINFPNEHNVYLHDTPHRELFGRNARYESSGCVRVDKVHELVDWIMNGQDGFDKDLIEEIAISEQRQDVKVLNPPDLRIMYLTAWATEDGRVHFRPDIYNLDGTGFILGQPEARPGI